MKCYEATGVFVSKPEMRLVEKIFAKKCYKKPLCISSKVHYIVYDHEDKYAIGLALLSHLAYDDESYKMNPWCMMLEQQDFNVKKIEFDEINPNLVPTKSQWARYLRVKRHPNFNWDEYIKMPKKLNLSVGQKCSMVAECTFRAKSESPFQSEITRISYELDYDSVPGIKRVTSENIRQYLIDPLFNDNKEYWDFANQGEKNK